MIAPWARSPATANARGASSSANRCVISAVAISGMSGENRAPRCRTRARRALRRRRTTGTIVTSRIWALRNEIGDRFPGGRHECDRARRDEHARTASSNPRRGSGRFDDDVAVTRRRRARVPSASAARSLRRRAAPRSQRRRRDGARPRRTAVRSFRRRRRRPSSPARSRRGCTRAARPRAARRSTRRRSPTDAGKGDEARRRRRTTSSAHAAVDEHAEHGLRRSRDIAVVVPRDTARTATARHDRAAPRHAVPSSRTPAISCPSVRRGQAGADHLEIGAADSRTAHADAHTRRLGRGHVDHADPGFGVAHGSHRPHSRIASLRPGSARRRNAMATSGSILGNPVLRKEDPGILRGRRSTTTT